jgi:adenosine deaminase
MHKIRGVAYATLIEGMNNSKALAATKPPGLSVAFILCHVRHLPLQSAFEMIKDIAEAGHIEDGTVAGIGMSSTEIGMRPSMFESFYEAAREAGIQNRTAHAGKKGQLNVYQQPSPASASVASITAVAPPRKQAWCRD